MSKEDAISVEATVMEPLPNAMFRVKLDTGDHKVLAHVSGKMRKSFIKVPAGRPRPGGAVPLRSEPRPDRLPVQVGAAT